MSEQKESKSASLELHESNYNSCFISYSSFDKEFAEKIYADLSSAGVNCWFAPEDMRVGDKLRPTLDNAVMERQKLLLILSEHSVQSDWVEQEVETAFEKERLIHAIVLFPITLDDTIFNMITGWAAHIKRTRYIGDFRRWQEGANYQKSFQRVLRDLLYPIEFTS